MGRRIQWLGVGMVLLFALIIIQLANIQVREATRLDNTPHNPRNAGQKYENFRGEILAANGTVLAQSVKMPANYDSSYQYMRTYPQNTLFSQIVGYDSIYRGTSEVENVYNDQLIEHTQPAKNISQFLSPPAPSSDNVTLTVEPYLQSVVKQALANVVSPDKDGAVVVLNPATGAVLAMYSSPSFNPNTVASPTLKLEESSSVADFTVKDSEGYYPGYPIATFERTEPGSTFKMVTTSAVYNLKPTLSNFYFPTAGCTTLPDSTKLVCNDGRSPSTPHTDPCGGYIATMLPISCDPGYVKLGIAIGPTAMYQQAKLFGYDQKPPIDLTTVAVSNFPTKATFKSQGRLGLAGLGLSAFGQQTVLATPLQQAMVASAIADGGTLMTPHVMASIHTASGTLVEKYKPTTYKQSMSPQTAINDNNLMQAVVAHGTAAQVGFPYTMHAAVKTGTAQTGLTTKPTTNTQDWMIGFAPATHPQVAVCVLVPYQPTSSSGAEVAGPIMKAVLTAALHPPAGQ